MIETSAPLCAGLPPVSDLSSVSTPVQRPGRFTQLELVDGDAVMTVVRREITEPRDIREFSDELITLVDDADAGGTRVLLNVSCFERISSQLLAALVAFYKHIERQGGELVLCHVNRVAAESLRTCHVDRLVTVLPSDAVPAPDAFPDEQSAAAVTKRSATVHETPAPVLVCVPDAALASTIRRSLTDTREVVVVASLDALAEPCRNRAPAVVVLSLDWQSANSRDVPDLSAVERFLHTRGHWTSIVICTRRQLKFEQHIRLLRRGARRILDARANLSDELVGEISRLANDYQAHCREIRTLPDRFTEFHLVGRSPALNSVFRQAYEAAQLSHLTVLIQGETGTGKGLLSQAIHGLDPQRSGGVCHTVNCATIASSLAASELFGHAAGAFTGAGEERQGAFRTADGGTLILDEIGELDLDVQAKLLRVLEHGVVLPVGADSEVAVDVRVIAASNRPLIELIEQGRFREDLYQRLSSLVIHIPPLRERPDDIAAQADFFLELWRGEHPHRLRGLGANARKALTMLPWTGNSRELAKTLRQALLDQPPGPQLRLEDLPRSLLDQLASATAVPHQQANAASHEVPTLQPESGFPATDPLDQFVRQVLQAQMSLSQARAELERRLLTVALKAHGGNRQQAAQALGVHWRTVYNKVNRYGLNVADVRD